MVIIFVLFADLQRLLPQQFGLQLSIATIKRMGRKLGWIKTGPRYCQHVREHNHVNRLAFAQRCIANKEQFDDVIFTDESSIWLERHGKICSRKIGEPGKMKPTVKQSTCLGRNFKKWCHRSPYIHRNNEEGILCDRNSERNSTPLH